MTRPASRCWRKAAGLLVAVGMCAATTSWAQIAVPLHFDMQDPVVDELGQVLPGTADAPGALVQILSIGPGIVPPGVDGRPHSNNVVLAEARIGEGVDPASGVSGKASGSIRIPRSTPMGMFARIFNRGTLASSSFYTDSAPFTNSTTAYGIFVINASQTTKPLDSSDDDGDGLHNSWEKSHGSNRHHPDTDGDGMSDGAEFRAGTALGDSDSYLALVQLKPAAGGNLTVSWDAVPGKSYQLQFTPMDLAAHGVAFSNVNGVVTASATNLATVVTNGMSYPAGSFRLLLVE